MNELEATLILSHALRLHSLKARSLIEKMGSAQKALDTLENWKEETSWKKDLELVEKEKVRLLSFFSTDYPAEFLKLPDPPLLLYVKGSLVPKDCRSLAIVGTRLCSLYGKEMASKVSRELAASGLTIVSGLARGIDTAAHEGALQTGRTLAVIGSGLSQIYPRENLSLASAIAEQGALVSELPMFTPPEKRHFPKRNRLVSALSRGVLLAEAPLKSGAMITLDIARSQKKICFAFPGRADMESFQGNHWLIKTQKAHLVENSTDVLSLLEPGMSSLPFPLERKTGSFQSLDPEERELAARFPSEEISIDELSLRMNLPIAKLNSLLMGLILKEVIREFPGKFYKKVI